jgi:hypothetical protein
MKAKFNSILCRYPEVREAIYSTTTFSFVGDLPLSIFLELVPANALRSIKQVHMVWPTWWKRCGWYHTAYGGRVTPLESYWGHPRPRDAGAEWDEIWQKVGMMGRLKRLHLTIFDEPGVPADSLLPALRYVEADDLFVEAWGHKAETQEPTDYLPLQIQYNPLLRN